MLSPGARLGKNWELMKYLSSAKLFIFSAIFLLPAFSKEFTSAEPDEYKGSDPVIKALMQREKDLEAARQNPTEDNDAINATSLAYFLDRDKKINPDEADSETPVISEKGDGPKISILTFGEDHYLFQKPGSDDCSEMEYQLYKLNSSTFNLKIFQGLAKATQSLAEKSDALQKKAEDFKNGSLSSADYEAAKTELNGLEAELKKLNSSITSKGELLIGGKTLIKDYVRLIAASLKPVSIKDEEEIQRKTVEKEIISTNVKPAQTAFGTSISNPNSSVLNTNQVPVDQFTSLANKMDQK
ncbi:MAG: hypothetical protein JWQ35_2717 [Bacteriovoracaceae bacterium]|nr:hypothetical protein [Bacteriovoracaceae bacterium]